MNPLRSELRWHAKKITRRACIALSTMLAAPPDGVRVLTYHRFATSRHDPFAIEPAVFERQIEWIARRRLAVSLDQFVGFLAGRRSLAADSVLLTIDDAYASLHAVALPILRRHRVPAVAFIPAGLIDWPSEQVEPEPRLTWEQIRELSTAGIEIGSHGWSHRSFGDMHPEEMRIEARRSRCVLETQSGQPVRAFAYPYGTRADYSRSSGTALRQAGYQCAFTAQHGSVGRDHDLFELPRVKIEGGEGMWAFAHSCRGGLDAWGAVDRRFAVLQARNA